MNKQFLEVGKVLKTHGLHGALKVQHWCDNSYVFKNFNHIYFSADGEGKIKVNILNFKDSFVVLKFVGIDSINKAFEFVGRVLFAHRSDFKIPNNRSFIQDLIGASVVDCLDKNLCYGKIVDVLNYGANDIYKIKNSFGREFLIPVINSVVREKKLDEGLILINPMEGLFDV